MSNTFLFTLNKYICPNWRNQYIWSSGFWAGLDPNPQPHYSEIFRLSSVLGQNLLRSDIKLPKLGRLNIDEKDFHDIGNKKCQGWLHGPLSFTLNFKQSFNLQYIFGSTFLMKSIVSHLFMKHEIGSTITNYMIS